MSQMTVNNSSSVSFSVLSGEGARSPQLALAMLQMELARANKEEALKGIKSIEDQQAQKTKIAELLNQAREYKSSDATKSAGDPPYTSGEFNKSIEGMGFSIPNDTDNDKNGKNWDKLIAQLQTKMDSTGADIQTQMVKLQDFMGQYNSYMQGANSAISSSNQVLTSLARGQ